MIVSFSRKYTLVYVCVCMYVYVCMYMYVCMYIVYSKQVKEKHCRSIFPPIITVAQLAWNAHIIKLYLF
jgi:hypothetical protein